MWFKSAWKTNVNFTFSCKIKIFFRFFFKSRPKPWWLCLFSVCQRFSCALWFCSQAVRLFKFFLQVWWKYFGAIQRKKKKFSWESRESRKCHKKCTKSFNKLRKKKKKVFYFDCKISATGVGVDTNKCFHQRIEHTKNNFFKV